MYVVYVYMYTHICMWIIFTETFESKWKISRLFTPKYSRMYFLRIRTFCRIPTVWLSLLQCYLKIPKQNTGHKSSMPTVLLQLHSQNMNLSFKRSP